MKMLQRCAGVLLVLLVSAVAVLADIAEPPRKVKNNVKPVGVSRMSIEADGAASEVRLQIPRGMLRQMRAGLDPSDPASAAATTGAFNLPPTQTLFAGLFLSLSIITGGLWLVRSRRRSLAQRVAVALALCALCGLFLTGVARANAGLPPPLDAGTLTQSVSAGATLSGSVRLEVVSDGDEIKLIIPKAATARGE